MPPPDSPQQRPSDFVEAEFTETTEVLPESQPLAVVGGETPTGLQIQIELRRLDQQHELELSRLQREEEEKKHLRKKEVLDRVFGHVMRFTVVAGGIALFPLHYPVVGGLLLGAGLDLLTKSELRSILKGAITGAANKRGK